jgi:hypothetical protein
MDELLIILLFLDLYRKTRVLISRKGDYDDFKKV